MHKIFEYGFTIFAVRDDKSVRKYMTLCKKNFYLIECVTFTFTNNRVLYNRRILRNTIGEFWEK